MQSIYIDISAFQNNDKILFEMQHGVMNVIYYDVVKNLPWKYMSMDLKTVVHCLFCLPGKTEICLFFLDGHCIHPAGEFK